MQDELMDSVVYLSGLKQDNINMQDINPDAGDNEAVILEPFVHQVGGRSCMLYLDESTLCKMYIQREVDIYNILPACVKQFVPDFRGIVDVHFNEDDDGYIRAAVVVPKRERKFSKSKFRIRRTNSIDIESDSPIINIFEDSQEPSGNCIGHNPWVLKCHREHLTNLLSMNEVRQFNKCNQQFILLENLTCDFIYPCVLDVKMGTRHHTDDASPGKKQRHTAKAHASTSAKLGCRLGGMQVYRTTPGKYICHNKLYGRGLSEEGFQKTMYEYLFNGTTIRTDIIPEIIERLNNLKATFQELDAFRFYTSSILIIYEGQTQNGVKPEKTTDVRVIDFAHTTHHTLGDPVDYTGPDQGFIVGIDNLVNIMTAIMNKHNNSE